MWRAGPDVLGWSALPPASEPQHRADYDRSYSDHWSRASGWVFCEDRLFLERDLSNHLIAAARNETMVRHTQPAGGVRMSNAGQWVNDVIGQRRVETAIGAAVAPARVRYQQSISPRIETRIDKNEVTVVRPLIGDRTRHAAAPRTTLPAELNDRDGLLQKQRQEAEQLAALHQHQINDLGQLHESQRLSAPESLGEELQRQQREERDALDQQQEQQRVALERWHQLQCDVLNQSQGQAIQPAVERDRP
jgi:hypothetical protein